MEKTKCDFSGYVTKINVKCSDGRTIRDGAFKHMDGVEVPLVWSHLHNDPTNVLGHVLLEYRPNDGVYGYASFNDSEKSNHMKAAVKHNDVKSMSIYANELKEQSGDVIHGTIREVSLVLAGANPEAKIDYLSFSHADGSITESEDEAIIFTTEVISHSADQNGKTVQEVYDSLNEEQKELLYAMVGKAIEEAQGDSNIEHSDEGGNTMKQNIFDNQKQTANEPVLTHEQFGVILSTAMELGSLKKAVIAHADEYGIKDIETLFPDAKPGAELQWEQREDEWVVTVLNGVTHSPFSRIKTVFADTSFAEARAKGYVKASEKKEVYLKVAKEVTQPTTVYVKQKLDRDDIIDVTDFNIVDMVRRQMRVLLNEELAKAYLTGDLRDPEDNDKIDENCIKPIWTAKDIFCTKEVLTSATDYKAMVKQIAKSHRRYKGSGNPVFFTTPEIHTELLWIEDQNGRRIYESDATLCAALRVSKIVEVPYFEGLQRTDASGNKFNLIGIKVNLKDYKAGADKGGQIANFDDFDIDFNQYKYLMETRCSGSLVKAKSAQVYEVKAGTAPADPDPEEESGN